MVIVFGHYACAELPQPFQLCPDRITPQVEMDAILYDLRRRHQLEDGCTPDLDEDVRAVLRIKNPPTAQPGEFRLVVRPSVEGGGPEAGDAPAWLRSSPLRQPREGSASLRPLRQDCSSPFFAPSVARGLLMGSCLEVQESYASDAELDVDGRAGYRSSARGL